MDGSYFLTYCKNSLEDTSDQEVFYPQYADGVALSSSFWLLFSATRTWTGHTLAFCTIQSVAKCVHPALRPPTYHVLLRTISLKSPYFFVAGNFEKFIKMAYADVCILGELQYGFRQDTLKKWDFFPFNLSYDILSITINYWSNFCRHHV